MTKITPLKKYASKNIFLKLENLQPFGSYKVRGIQNIIENLSESELRHGLSAASAGNMGQAVAHLARARKIPCTIVVPDTAPKVKIAAIQKTGATVILKQFSQVWDLVRDPISEKPRGYFIHPANNDLLLQGYGKLIDELYEQKPDLDSIIVPFGVGGLTLGLSQRIRALKLKIKLYTVEPETAAPLFRFCQSGQERVDRIPSFVDAIGTPEVIQNLRPVLKKQIDGCTMVTLDEIKFALGEIYRTQNMMVEGAGAAALAAALSEQVPSGNTACIVSGGNIDPEVFESIINSSRNEKPCG